MALVVSTMNVQIAALNMARMSCRPQQKQTNIWRTNATTAFENVSMGVQR